jgi:hypothetical protein
MPIFFWLKPQPGEDPSGPYTLAEAGQRITDGAVMWPEQELWIGTSEDNLMQVSTSLAFSGTEPADDGGPPLAEVELKVTVSFTEEQLRAYAPGFISADGKPLLSSITAEVAHHLAEVIRGDCLPLSSERATITVSQEVESVK